ncbi:MAG: thiamine phosphate synthase [Planctomycetota bacterium]|nr:thiamine phosphate synthase [Planctomycetota bacterium]MDA1137306.1 thiamine phosphate synthase [Planctomycetota bacterium]
MDRSTLCRIIDANFNRAGEALREIEDAARFGLNSHLLSQQAKHLRHRLVQGIRSLALSPAELNASRDSSADVGRPEKNAVFSERDGVSDLVAAAFKRLQQAVRSLEEYSKLLEPDADTGFEQIRYDSYTAEKAFFARLSNTEKLVDRRLYLLLIGSVLDGGDHETALRAAIDGGVQVVQLREKEMTDREFFSLAENLRSICERSDVICLINDRTHIARAVDADGVHIGDDDLAPNAARKVLGPGKILGATSHTLEEAKAGQRAGADYLGFGTMFPTETKSGLTIRGPEEWSRLKGHIEIPVYAIGGITLENLHQLTERGVGHVAVSAGILRAPDIAETAARFRRQLEATV